MQNYTGVIIEESLTDKSVLNKIKIADTKVEPVTEEHQTPHVKQWTLHSVEILPEQAENIAEELSRVLAGNDETGHWYADFQNDQMVYIIFPNKVFKISRNNPAGFQAAKEYGLSLGIPGYQVDFSPEW